MSSVPARRALQFTYDRILEIEERRGRVVSEMLHCRSSGNWKHGWRLLEQPRNSNLRRLRSQQLGCSSQWSARLGQVTGSKRKPWDEPDPLPCAIVQYVLGGSVDQIVAVLHRDDRRHAPDSLDLLYANFGQTYVADLTLALKIEQRADLILESHLGIDSVKLEQIDPLQPQPPEAAFARRTDMLGASILDPLVGTRPQQACLGRNHQTGRIWVQRLGNKPL